jgi:FkbM family methyltransferase
MSTVILRHPSTITLLRDFEAVGSQIAESRKQMWAQFPVTKKRAYGFSINLNSADTTISPAIGVDGWIELEETELVRKLLRKGMVFVDVGSNIGWYALLSAKIVGDKGVVIAYEPEPSNFSLLSKSVTENGFKNIKAFQQCVSESVLPKTLWLAAKNLGAHSIIKSISNQGISVNSTTLDVSLKNLGIKMIDILKIDVEGAEPNVIEGARQTLAESRIKNIIMEWNQEVWSEHTLLLDYLLDTFDVYEIVKSPFLVRRVDREELNHLPQVNIFLRLSPN